MPLYKSPNRGYRPKRGGFFLFQRGGFWLDFVVIPATVIHVFSGIEHNISIMQMS